MNYDEIISIEEIEAEDCYELTTSLHNFFCNDILKHNCDGYAVLAFKRKGKITLLSRSGKDYTGQFPEIENELKNLPIDNIVFHGERMPIGFMEMTAEKQFKMAASGQKKGEKTGFCLAVYDCVPITEWDKQKCNSKYSERYSQYMNILKNCKFLFPLPNLYIGNDINEIEKWFKWAKENDREGLIIKNMDSFYEWDRSKDLAKVKSVEETDLKIVGFEEGRGKLKDSLGAIICEFRGSTIRCGGGFKEVERKKIWKNQSKFINQIAEIIYMEISRNKLGKESLRHPRFKCFKNEDIVNFLHN
jgi:ATP-dependent DNA ligase